MTKPTASDPIAFAVAGSPAPQGSKSAVINHTTGRAQLLEGRTTGQRQKFKAWRNTVATAAMIALRHHGRITPLLGPVSVDILFVHTRPQSTPKGQRWHTKSPDIDKMARSCLDALKVGGCIGDDNQVAELTCRKVLALPGETEGAVITITPLDHTHAPTSVAHLLPAPAAAADGVGTSGQAHRASTAR